MRLHPKDQAVVRQVFGSAAPFVERSAELAETPVGRTTVKVAKVVGVAAALAVIFGSVDLRS